MAQALGITLPIQLGNMGYFQQAYDTLTQIKSNFINLILTRKGERVHQPEFGCGIHDYLFEQLTPENIEGARRSVEDAVSKWMPFLEITQFELNASNSDIDSNKLQVYVVYRITSRPNIQDVVILTF